MLWETPWPDLLQCKQTILCKNVSGIEVDWKIGSGFNKSKQIAFHADDSFQLMPLKEKLDRIFHSKGFVIQSCWVPREGTQITYHFANCATVSAL